MTSFMEVAMEYDFEVQDANLGRMRWDKSFSAKNTAIEHHTRLGVWLKLGGPYLHGFSRVPLSVWVPAHKWRAVLAGRVVSVNVPLRGRTWLGLLDRYECPTREVACG